MVRVVGFAIRVDLEGDGIGFVVWVVGFASVGSVGYKGMLVGVLSGWMGH